MPSFGPGADGMNNMYVQMGAAYAQKNQGRSPRNFTGNSNKV